MNIKIKLILLALFILINATVYILTQKNSNNIVDNELQENLLTLQTHYNILLTSQKNISFAIYKSILRNTDVKTLLGATTKNEQTRNRKKLQLQLVEQYKTAKKQGILQINFVDKNNISFLCMSKIDMFGDDLTKIRADFAYTNKTQKPIRGFVQGRMSHGFRNTFPVFNNVGTHIGAMEISFSSNKFEWYLNNISHIHTHFLINKKILNIKTLQKSDLILNYSQSSENSDFMHSLFNHTQAKCSFSHILNQQNIKKEIKLKMAKNASFSSYALDKKSATIFSFLPVENIEKQTVAWFVSYKDSSAVYSTLKISLIIQIVTFVLSIIIIILLIKEIHDKKLIESKRKKAQTQTQKIENQAQDLQEHYDLFDEVLNATNNILFITDFKNIQFSNNRFKKLLKIEKRKELSTKSGTFIMSCTYKDNCSNSLKCKKNFDILDIFVIMDGFLHQELLIKNETFIELLQRTDEKEKIVSIMNSNFEPKAFTIDAVKLKNNGDYLITLSDITDIKEEFIKTEKKAYIDGLTRVYNRNKFDELFEDELVRVKRYSEPLSLAIIDIDNFKNFNDTYGHLIGDEVLITMAQTVKNHLRDSDTFARWGGEEFVVLFRNTSIVDAKKMSQHLKETIEENSHPLAGKITASFGLTEYKYEDTTKSILKRCDDALYLAKKNGRNRVEIL